MAHVLRVLSLANGMPSGHDGKFVQGYDPDTPFGCLALTSTDEKADALRFETMTELLDFRQLVSSVAPVRPDGEPNRPLSGLTLEVVRVE